MRYELAIFDFDGTLADSFHWFLRIANAVADKYRFRRIANDEIETLRGYDNRKIIEHLKVPMWKVPLVARYVRKRMTQDITEISLFPGVSRMLKDLVSKGVAPAIVSSNSEVNVRTVLGAENADLIKYYACDASLFGKSAKIKKVLRRSNRAAADAICIGDEVRDLHSARTLGVDFGAVAWGYASPKSFTPYLPEEVFLNMNDIVEKLTQ